MDKNSQKDLMNGRFCCLVRNFWHFTTCRHAPSHMGKTLPSCNLSQTTCASEVWKELEVETLCVIVNVGHVHLLFCVFREGNSVMKWLDTALIFPIYFNSACFQPMWKCVCLMYLKCLNGYAVSRGQERICSRSQIFEFHIENKLVCTHCQCECVFLLTILETPLRQTILIHLHFKKVGFFLEYSCFPRRLWKELLTEDGLATSQCWVQSLDGSCETSDGPNLLVHVSGFKKDRYFYGIMYLATTCSASRGEGPWMEETRWPFCKASCLLLAYLNPNVFGSILVVCQAKSSFRSQL